MAPAAAASTLAATSGAAAASKRPAASEAEPHLLDSSSALLPQQGDEAAREGQPPKQQPQPQLECPRCRSTNTKFCYYNNYSTAQPRHFCRACRRYWTHGGTLRNVPVGGATRRGGGAKRRRLSAEPSSPPPLTTAARAADNNACPDLPAATAAFPFLTDGSFLVAPPQFDLGAAPAAFSWPSSVVPDFCDGLAPWDDGAAGAWGDVIAGLELTWPPPGN